MNEVEVLYQDEIQQTLEPATVPFQDYLDLEDKYEELEHEFIEFKQDVFNLVVDERFGELVEYLKQKGVF